MLVYVARDGDGYHVFTHEPSQAHGRWHQSEPGQAVAHVEEKHWRQLCHVGFMFPRVGLGEVKRFNMHLSVCSPPWILYGDRPR